MSCHSARIKSRDHAEVKESLMHTLRMMPELSPEESADLFVLGLGRFEWAHGKFDEFVSSSLWQDLEFRDKPAVCIGNDGFNFYPVVLERILYSAKRAAQTVRFMSLPQTGAGYGTVPLEILLRHVITASARAIFLLAPRTKHKRENRLNSLLKTDQSSYQFALESESKLLGEQSPQFPKVDVIREIEMVKDATQFLVRKGFKHTKTDKRVNPKDLRYRLNRKYWEYSSVDHANLWHLMTSATPTPSGTAVSTGDIGQATDDISILYAEAVCNFLYRYGLGEWHGDFPVTLDTVAKIEHEGEQIIKRS